MKKVLFLLILAIFSCKYSYFYDIDAPQILFYSFIGSNKFLLQFNEPVEVVEILLKEKNFKIKNAFPKANIFISTDIFEKYTKNDLIIRTKDTSNNNAEIKILDIFNNPNLAIISINEIRLKYTKKLNQMLSFNVQKDGNLAGIQLITFNREKKNIITFENCEVRKNENLKINFLYNKELKNEKNSINFAKNKSINFEVNKRLNQTNSLILVIDNANNLLDYILYYDSKKNSLEELKNNKTFKNYLLTLNKYGITNPIISDINGNSSKKTIIKYKNIYVVKNK